MQTLSNKIKLETNKNYKQLIKVQNVLVSHPILSSVKTSGQMKHFMESYCYSLYNFTVMLEELEKRTSLIDIIKKANKANKANKYGYYYPHYDLYLEAMKNIKCDTRNFNSMVININTNNDPFLDLKFETPVYIQKIIYDTIDIIKNKSTIDIASCLYFSNEHIINNIYNQYILKNTNNYCHFSNYVKKNNELYGFISKTKILPLFKNIPDENFVNEYNKIILSGIKTIENKIKFLDDTLHYIK